MVEKKKGNEALQLTFLVTPLYSNAHFPNPSVVLQTVH